MSNHVTREDIQVKEESHELLERKENIREQIKRRYDLYKAGKDRFTQAEAKGFKAALDIVETKWDEEWNWVAAMKKAEADFKGTPSESSEFKHALFIAQAIVKRYRLHGLPDSSEEKLLESFNLKYITDFGLMKMIVSACYNKTGNKFWITFAGSKGYMSHIEITCEGDNSENNRLYLSDILTARGDFRKKVLNIYYSEANGVRLELVNNPRKKH